MKILFTQRGTGGGSATGLLDLIRALDGGHVEPVVMLYDESRFRAEFEEAGARTILLWGSKGGDPRNNGRISDGTKRMWRKLGRFGALIRLIRAELPVARKIAQHIQRIQPDIVHHNIHPTTDRAGIVGALWSRVPQISHVRWVKETVPFVDPLIARGIDRFVYMSNAIRDDVQPRLHIPKGRGSVIYDPFDLDRWNRNGPEDGTKIRSDLGIPQGAVVLTNVGRLVSWKGQDVFLRAVGLLDSEEPPVHAILIGDAGSQGRDHFVERLHSISIELGLEERVHFLGFRRDIPEIMEASDVVVHSSTIPEPFGRVVVEGLAAGRPVVATAAGGPLEIVEHGETGMLVEPGNPEAMASALRSLIRNPARASRMGERGRVVATARFGASRFADEIMRIYEGILTA